MSILYVCGTCQQHSPETCGRDDRNELRVLPNGSWICDGCFDDLPSDQRDEWRSLPPPPEYVPAA